MATAQKWKPKVQTYHGGQDWKECENYVADFSVTTNCLGCPQSGIDAVKKSVELIEHYPPSNFEPTKTNLANFIWLDRQAAEDGHSRLLLGNGASELISLVAQKVYRESRESGSENPGWRPGSQLTMYKEYQRASEAAGFTRCKWNDKSAKLLCLVNPTNPTGDYWNIQEMKTYIEEQCPDNSAVLVDESMQMWLGDGWQEDSLVNQSAWIKTMAEERNINIYIMHSWTKIWTCAGIRLGSVIAPTAETATSLISQQVPWSVNVLALVFLDAVIKDTEYLKKTWAVTTKWRASSLAAFQKAFPEWKYYGADFTSWIWIDTGSEETAKKAHKLAKAAGCPIRFGGYGYLLPTYIRIRVYDPEKTQILLDCLQSGLSNDTPKEGFEGKLTPASKDLPPKAI